VDIFSWSNEDDDGDGESTADGQSYGLSFDEEYDYNDGVSPLQPGEERCDVCDRKFIPKSWGKQFAITANKLPIKNRRTKRLL
jgi:hypothetical protein